MRGAGSVLLNRVASAGWGGAIWDRVCDRFAVIVWSVLGRAEDAFVLPRARGTAGPGVANGFADGCVGVSPSTFRAVSIKRHQVDWLFGY